MSLRPPDDLYFYSELEDSVESFTGCFFVGLFSVPSHDVMCLNEAARALAKSKPRRLFGLCEPAAPKLQPMPTRPDCICRAGAMVRQTDGTLIVENIGADKGYGPTLYAAIIELARLRKLKGARPCREPNKVLPKPKEIWRRFSEDQQYLDQVRVTAVQGVHAEVWLNCVYSTIGCNSLINIDLMRESWRRFYSYWADKGIFESTWTDMCREKARLSVDAHQSP